MWIFIFIALFQFSNGLQCYQCTAQRPQRPNATENLCSNFDYFSQKFRVDCPLSTFCMKKNYTLELPDGRKAMVTERGCAPQTDASIELQNGKWKEIKHIRTDAYKDGCQVENRLDNTRVSFCFCSTYLCNTGSSLRAFTTKPVQVYGVWLFLLLFAYQLL